MFRRTDDPIADFHRYDAERHRRLSRLPKCTECNHHIQQEKAVRIKGNFYCDDCLKDLREMVGDDFGW